VFLCDTIDSANGALSSSNVNHTLLRSPGFHVMHAQAATEFRFVRRL
jgi:hypothetical protein